MWWKRRIYLDRAAGMSGNPSSLHEEGRRAKRMLEDARIIVARLVEVQADDVIFTSSATESNALAILGHVRALRALAGPDVPGRNNMHVLYLPSAHASIIENMKILEKEGVAVEPLPITDFRVDTALLTKMLRPETVLVSMDAVCGETGVVWNTREVAGILKKGYSAPSEKGSAQAAKPMQHPFSGMASRPLLHVDASQAPLTEKITRAHFDADMLTFDASKISEVRGIGVLVAHRTIPLEPLYRGGGQERGLRAGSESPELAREFARALAAAVRTHDSFRMHAFAHRARLAKLLTVLIPDIQIQEGKAQAPHILNLSLPGRDTDYLVTLLDEEGFAVSTRSACETDSEEGSRAVFFLTGDPARARSTLRVSWGPSTRSRALMRFAKTLARAVAFIDNPSRG
ncbi:MAG: aminotransferase class V-fold PLP-dependent enzyme [Candidatus Pacebacteria bacterium]|nr:aminotransferase class V-fold PLP-dependent enzyme [Candidatus Paceibacterota bacterium]